MLLNICGFERVIYLVAFQKLSSFATAQITAHSKAVIFLTKMNILVYRHEKNWVDLRLEVLEKNEFL